MNDEVHEAVEDWIRKAESDWTTVEILVASDRCPPESVCFHCQQHVEKLLKAILTAHRIETPKTHDIRRLAQLAEPYATELATLLDTADILTSQAVVVRYPGDWHEVDAADMDDVLVAARSFRGVLLPSISSMRKRQG